MAVISPLMQQYAEIKQHYKDVLLLFQVGDFYELFYEDAKIAAAFLGITLTKRGHHNDAPIPLCGVPVHVVDHYLIKLVRGGFSVALCNQVTQPQPGRLVERSVTAVLTPGTLTDSKLLPDKSSSYLAVLYISEHSFALAVIEILTGSCFVTAVAADQKALFEAELQRFMPDEIILVDTKWARGYETQLKRAGYWTKVLAPVDDVCVDQWLQNVAHDAYQFIGASIGMYATLHLLHNYLMHTQERAVAQITRVHVYNPDNYLIIDAATQRNLELVRNNHDGSAQHTLFDVLDHAVTSMGSRTIKKWINRPLTDSKRIQDRQQAIEGLLYHTSMRELIVEKLKVIGDVERVVGRIALGRAQLSDYLQVRNTLQVLPALMQIVVQHMSSDLIHDLISQCNALTDVLQLLEAALNDDHTQEWSIKSGYHVELDRLRMLVDQGARAIMALELEEQQQTGISSLKIKFSQAHGYGIEITKPNLDRVPERYMRLQTLVNRERFTTQELRDLEYDIQRARTDSVQLEKELFAYVVEKAFAVVGELKKIAHALAVLDAMVGLATAAYLHNYVRPTFHEGRDIIIKQGRHPVVAQVLQHDFIPNDTALIDTASLWIITGPNMGGKSTYLRQVALICIMAQIGSFVPAAQAQLPILDRIFTRIGAADNVAQGKSTFLVEMEETALICNQATSRSLVILDEVGRGTSTYDGLAIAQAVMEHIHTQIRARCLFATHYHELTSLTYILPGIGLYYLASRKTDDGIVLLHQLTPGVAEGSFGIDVAITADLPVAVVLRAQQILMAR